MFPDRTFSFLLRGRFFFLIQRKLHDTQMKDILLKEIKDLEKDLEEKEEKSRIYREELERQCDLKYEKLWQIYEDFIDEFIEKTHEMFHVSRRITKEQVEKWRKFLRETEKNVEKIRNLGP